jgi:hypothetical protein
LKGHQDGAEAAVSALRCSGGNSFGRGQVFHADAILVS